MSAIFRRVSAQTLEFCNGRRVSPHDIADISVVFQKHPLFPLGPFLIFWSILWVTTAGISGFFDVNKRVDTHKEVVWPGLLAPALLLIRRKRYMVRVMGASNELLLVLDVPEGAKVASQMVHELICEVKKSPSFSILKPYTSQEALMSFSDH